MTLVEFVLSYTLDLLNMIFKLPVRVIAAASSQSGKSTFIIQLLKNYKTLMTGQVDHIIWSCHNRLFAPDQAKTIPGIKIVEGLPPIETVPPNTLLVIDDLQMSDLKEICTIFCVSSHHKNISIFFLIQNLFFSNPFMRTILLNCTTLCSGKMPAM